MFALIDTHFAARAITGEGEACGDTGIILDDGCFLGLVDALGHGPVAAEIAEHAKDYLLHHYHLKLSEIIQGLHDHLKNTRGAVAAVCRLDRSSGILHYSGMGNIRLRIFGHRPQILITRDGILGYMIPSPEANTIQLHDGDILIMHSDGIREHFAPDGYPSLLMGQASDICKNFIEQLGKSNDDVSCIALRYGI